MYVNKFVKVKNMNQYDRKIFLYFAFHFIPLTLF
jgi:hypothetical protein